jgi:ppGpp synthetase/RelA/SpoT-type nucleotidyltranferase
MDFEIELDDDEGIAIFEEIYHWRETHAYPLSLVTPGVRNWVSQETEGEVFVGQRLKRFDRILSKLERFPSMRLAQMEDIAGCRAVLLDPEEVEAVASRIRRKWDVRGESDYREAGKPATGYRGLHLIVLRRDRLVEIQLRTVGQQYWAEMAERTSSRTGYALKDGGGPDELVRYFRVASELTWQRETFQLADAGLVAELEKLRPIVRPYFRASQTRRSPRR